jgi:hypothetical protein
MSRLEMRTRILAEEVALLRARLGPELDPTQPEQQGAAE